MTDRERLIELIIKSARKNADSWAEAAEIIADFLLENSVIVLPCKVGDTVYVIPNLSDIGQVDPRRKNMPGER